MLIKRHLIFVTLWLSIAPTIARSQSSTSDSTLPHSRDSSGHVYYVNRWLSGGICVAAAGGGILTIPGRSKPNLTDDELKAVDRNNVPAFDRWSLHRDPSVVPTYETYSTILQIGMAALPAALLIDPSIRKDWIDVMLMGLEVNGVVVGIYAISPLGPLFQTRYRPIVYYYPDPAINNVANGNNKNSFYSGHIASASAAAFFMAKVYSDYHPELGNDKYWLYAAAAVPSLAMGYARLMALDHFPSDVLVGLALGTTAGILIPELHRIGGRDMSMGFYSPQGGGAGLRLQWHPEQATK